MECDGLRRGGGGAKALAARAAMSDPPIALAIFVSIQHDFHALEVVRPARSFGRRPDQLRSRYAPLGSALTCPVEGWGQIPTEPLKKAGSSVSRARRHRAIAQNHMTLRWLDCRISPDEKPD